MSEEQDENDRRWRVDPSMYARRDEPSYFQRRIAGPLRSAGKVALFALALTYPFYLVYVGLAYGGLAFWSFFLGSTAIIGILLTRLGFAPNYRHWGQGYWSFIGLAGGFLAAVGFYASVIYLKLWYPVPLTLALGIGVYFLQRKLRKL